MDFRTRNLTKGDRQASTLDALFIFQGKPSKIRGAKKDRSRRLHMTRSAQRFLSDHF